MLLFDNFFDLWCRNCNNIQIVSFWAYCWDLLFWWCKLLLLYRGLRNSRLTFWICSLIDPPLISYNLIISTWFYGKLRLFFPVDYPYVCLEYVLGLSLILMSYYPVIGDLFLLCYLWEIGAVYISPNELSNSSRKLTTKLDSIYFKKSLVSGSIASNY